MGLATDAIKAWFFRDPERETLTEEARARSGGTFVRLTEGVTHIDVRGPEDGPVVVLIHGFSVPLYLWDGIVDRLANEGFRVVRYDLFGRGWSDRPEGRYGEARFDRQLADLLDALAIPEPVHLVGLSMAASIAATFASRRPSRVRSLTFLGPGFGAGRRAPLRLRAAGIGEALFLKRISPTLAPSQMEDLHHPERFPDWPDRYREQMRYVGFRRALLATLRDYMGRDCERDYRGVGALGVPTLLVWGAHDKRVSPEEQARIRAWIPGAEARIADDAGHLPHLERPDLVTRWIAEHVRRAEPPESASRATSAPSNETVGPPHAEGAERPSMLGGTGARAGAEAPSTTPRGASFEADFWADLRRERFLIVGFSERTGMHAGRLFARMEVPFSVSDSSPMETLAPRLQGLPIASSEVFAGPQTIAQLDGITAVLLSPGVPRSIPLLSEARARGIPIWSDYDLLFPLFSHKRIAAITGTDGKTTTTMLVAHIAGPDARVVVAGNMGTPITALYDEILACDVVVLELSSFMLEEVRRFHASVATVLNVAEDHVDRYASIGEYEATKRAILKHARRPDVFVQNLDDAKIAGWPLGDVDVRTVSLRDARADAWVEEGRLHLRAHPRSCSANIDADRLRIRGFHHRSNALVAASMAAALGVDPRDALTRATTFPGVPHRFEHVGRAGGVDLIDDSKATSVHAVQRALESLADRRVVLILGGRDKMLDPTPLRRVTGSLRAAVGYGEAGPRLLRAFEGTNVPVLYVERFAEAVDRACRLTEPGDVLLLSPACTSFDQHSDYAERGAEFREVARRILTRRSPP